MTAGPHLARLAGLAALALAAAATLAGCGDSGSSGAPGSAGNPLTAETTPVAAKAVRQNEAATASGRTAPAPSAAPPATERPGYRELLDRQTQRPASRFTPCNLVTKAQASAIVGSPQQDPLEAPQGPTCIYRSTDGGSFVTLAVQPTAFKKLRRQLGTSRRVAVADRAAYCGTRGQPTLYVPISSRRVLTVAAPCALALRFAAAAVRQLDR